MVSMPCASRSRMLLLRTSGEKGWVSEGFFRGFAKAFFMGFSAWGIGAWV